MGNLRGRKFRVKILGCRTNQSEAEALASELIGKGAVPSEVEWDFAILLSCTVTSEADRKCRQQVRRLRRENPEGLVVAAGCWAQTLEEDDAASLGIDAVVGNRLKFLVPDTIEALLDLPSRPRHPVIHRFSTPPCGEWDPLRLEKPVFHTRAFVKVQDGCDHFCSYCIVPFVRGTPVSRDPEDVLSEVRRVAACGCPEIVLTGVHLGLFRGSGEWTLGRLVEEIANVPGILRIRFGSIEPFALDEELISSLARTPSFCPHLHIPLQSGDDKVLAGMRRGYDASGFARVVERVRALWPADIHFSTDLLVGFPGETDEAFGRSLELVRKLGFGKLHVFPYSKRPGTAAAELEEQVPEAAVRKRCEEGIATGEELLGRFASTFLGSTVPVLVEKSRAGKLGGLIPQFVPAAWEGEGKAGEVLKVPVRRFENGALVP